MCMKYLKLTSGYRTALADGVLVPDSTKHMATEEFYHALPGDRLHLCGDGYLFAVAVFSLERDPVYIYSYAYSKEENWAAYTHNLTPESYGQEDYLFDEECYFRICVTRKDGEDLTDKDNEWTGKLLAFYHQEVIYTDKPYFEEEAETTVAVIREMADRQCMKLCLLADTHFTVNGTWEDTAHNIRKIAKQVEYDAIVHLGDLTDGMLSKDMTAKYVSRIIGDLEKCGVPIYITPGNHDSNYFRNKQNTFTVEEMRQLYRLYGTSDLNSTIKNDGKSLDYYIDIQKYSVRMIFLSSFEDMAPIRYGYTELQLKWLRNVLHEAKPGTRFLVFSHDAPLAKLDYWSFHIRNGEALLDILEEYNALEEYQVVGFFYGHTHADYVFQECSFPVISVGCAKLEYFTDKKPEGAIAWERKAGTVTQELWDSLLVDFEQQKLKLIRFGAGEDREVSFAKKKSSYKNIAIQRRKDQEMKIWAHRGASGHAPENTLPAFELASLLGADGIELDVQLSKDGIPVVIHDERIDRVSDGAGWVKDYTLEELRKFNVNKNFPAYGRVAIPTLSEVYNLVKDTGLTVNLELKNSRIFYEKLEEKVIKLAEEKGIGDRIIYSSFNHYSMLKIKQLKPEAKVAFLYSDGILDIAEYADKYHAYAVHPSCKNLDYPNVVNTCHNKNIRVHVWTVNEQADFDRMRELGADAVITNYVERG